MARIGEIEGAVQDRLLSLAALRQQEESIQAVMERCNDPWQRASLAEERDRIEDQQDAVIRGLQRDLLAYQRSKWRAVATFTESEPSVAQLGVMVAEKRATYKTRPAVVAAHSGR